VRTKSKVLQKTRGRGGAIRRAVQGMAARPRGRKETKAVVGTTGKTSRDTRHHPDRGLEILSKKNENGNGKKGESGPCSAKKGAKCEKGQGRTGQNFRQ